MFVEFSLYNINTNLLAVFSFLFEFPVSERAQSSLDLLVITLWPITGLDLQLLIMVTLGNPLDKANNEQIFRLFQIASINIVIPYSYIFT